MEKSKTLLDKIVLATRESGSKWFNNGQSSFFGDIEYFASRSKSNAPYFVQVTKKWGPDYVYIIKNVNEDMTLGDTIEEFDTLSEVEKWLEEN